MTLARVSAQLEVEVPGGWSTGDPGLRRQVQALDPLAELSWEGPSAALSEVFASASPWVAMSERELEAVRRHTARFVLRRSVSRAEPHTAALVLRSLRPVVARPEALGVHVRSVGKAHAVREWQSYQPGHAFDLLRAFVVWGTADHYRTWGMKHLGLPDAIIQGDLWPQVATAVLQAFCAERLERPGSDPAPEYALAPGSPVFRVQWTMAPPDDNPFGHLRLEAL